MKDMHGTTILGVKINDKVAVGGDGQVTLGNTVVKATAQKIRRLYDGKVIAGFAGATADAFTLFEKFEGKLKECKGNLKRAAVELAKDWRSDKILRRLEAMIIVADKNTLLLISGGNYALAAAKAFVENKKLSVSQIVERSLKIASDICIYTNNNIMIEEI